MPQKVPVTPSARPSPPPAAKSRVSPARSAAEAQPQRSRPRLLQAQALARLVLQESPARLLSGLWLSVYKTIEETHARKKRATLRMINCDSWCTGSFLLLLLGGYAGTTRTMSWLLCAFLAVIMKADTTISALMSCRKASA